MRKRRQFKDFDFRRMVQILDLAASDFNDPSTAKQFTGSLHLDQRRGRLKLAGDYKNCD